MLSQLEGGAEVCIEDCDIGGIARLQASSKGTGFVTAAVTPNVVIGAKPAVSQPADKHLPGNAMRRRAVVKQLQVEPVFRPVERGDRCQQSFHHSGRLVVHRHLDQHIRLILVCAGRIGDSRAQVALRPFQQIKRRQHEKAQSDRDHAQQSRGRDPVDDVERGGSHHSFGLCTADAVAAQELWPARHLAPAQVTLRVLQARSHIIGVMISRARKAGNDQRESGQPFAAQRIDSSANHRVKVPAATPIGENPNHLAAIAPAAAVSSADPNMSPTKAAGS